MEHAGRARRGKVLAGILFGIPPLVLVGCLAAFWFFWPPLALLRVGTGLPVYPGVDDAPYRTDLADYLSDHEYVIAFHTTDSVEQVRQFYRAQPLPPCYDIVVSASSQWRQPPPAITARVTLSRRNAC